MHHQLRTAQDNLLKDRDARALADELIALGLRAWDYQADDTRAECIARVADAGRGLAYYDGRPSKRRILTAQASQVWAREYAATALTALMADMVTETVTALINR